jgi:class 3 adenylate cyclase/tetratricopeptide (TPR) repeat protein
VPRLLQGWREEFGDEMYARVEGTLVHLDITGFTPLAERLARLGKEGAEELTFTLNERFGRMLTVAAEYGGDLLKFGGDALLLFFRGEQHERRACAAAAAMRAALRASGGHRGRRMRMSIGIQTGAFDMFVCGNTHRELLVLGPAASATVALEEAAGSGQILVSRATAASLPWSSVGPPAAGGFLLSRAPARALNPGTAAQARDDIEQYVPAALRSRLGTVDSDGEHRAAVIAFVRFEGVDAALLKAGPGEVAAALQALVTNVQAQAAEHDVSVLCTDTDRDGGKFMLAGGVPVAHTDDEERMLAALTGIAAQQGPFTLRSGAHGGRVFAGDVGSAAQRAYTVMGDAVNLAARVMAHAQPGEVLATAEAIDRARWQFNLRSVAPFAVKGKRRPVEAYLVEGAPPSSGASPAGPESRLVGRERELSWLLERAATAAAGAGTVVEITGEPGIGKSRLLRELVAHRPGTPCYHTQLSHTAARIPYYGFRALLSAVLGLEESPLGEATLRSAIEARSVESLPWMPLLGTVLDVEVPETPETESLAPQFRRDRLNEAVVELLGQVAPGPAIIAFDDCQLLDDASRELAARLAVEAGSHPWLVVFVGLAPGDGMAGAVPGVEILELGPLSEESSAELVATLIGPDAHPLDLARIEERAAGNPLYLLQLCEASGGREEPLPGDVEAVVNARLDSLPPETRRFLRTASVLGVGFPGPLLARLSGANGEVSAGRAPTAVSSFMEGAGPGFLRFRHRLVQEAAYESLPYRERRRLHQEAANIIRSGAVPVDDPVELLAFHFGRSGDEQESWEYACEAGERARAKHANVEAATFYAQAIESGRKLAEVSAQDLAAVYEVLGDVYEVMARYNEADEAYERGRRLRPQRSIDSARLLRKQGILRERRGHYTEALRWLRRSQRTLEDLDHDHHVVAERAELQLATAGMKFRQGRYRDCVDWCRQAISVAQASGLRAAEAHGYYLIENALSLVGHQEAPRYRDLALPIYEELGDLNGQANVLNNLGVSAYHEGRLDDAVALWERSRQAREQVGDVVGAAIAVNNIAEVHSDKGNLDVAEALFLTARRTFERTRFSVGVGFTTSNLGRLATRGGRFEEAEVLLHSALDMLRELGAGAFEAETWLRLAENALARGQDAVAHQRLDELESRLTRGAEHAPLRREIVRLREGIAASARDQGS